MAGRRVVALAVDVQAGLLLNQGVGGPVTTLTLLFVSVVGGSRELVASSSTTTSMAMVHT